MIYNYFDHESNSYISHLYYDSCYDNESLLKKLLLLSKIKCINNKLLKCTNTLLDGLTKTCIKTTEYISTIIIDNSNEFYSNNPQCANIALWKILRDKIVFNYNILFDLEYIPNNVAVVKSVMSYINDNKTKLNLNTSKIDIEANTINTIINTIDSNNITLISKNSEIVKNNQELSVSSKELLLPKNNIKYNVINKEDNISVKYDTFVINNVQNIVNSISAIPKDVELRDNIIIISNKNCNINQDE
jgi:hypothetical protein